MKETVMQRITPEDKARLSAIAASIEAATNQTTSNVDVLEVLIGNEYRRLVDLGIIPAVRRGDPIELRAGRPVDLEG